MDIVVGSGPSGISVTKALLSRGRQVTMVDGGQKLSPVEIARKGALAAKVPTEWSQQDVDDWQAPQFASNGELASRYGSTHAQLAAAETFGKKADGFGLRASHAIGGLSNVWGGAVLPSRQKDIADWLINNEDLKAHYAAVREFMPMSGGRDRLEALFPSVPMDTATPLKATPQGSRLHERLDKVADRLANEGVHTGRARQAVSADCRYCGMCLHGCPWDQIFSSKHVLNTLKRHPSFNYMSGRIVDRFAQQGAQVQVFFRDGSVLSGEKLFLAAGVLETARIVLSSESTSRRQLTLLDSQHFFLPMLHRWRPDGDPVKDPHHTLTEAFIEIDDIAISPYLTHTQVYGWNEFYAREMIANYGTKLPGSGPFFRALSRRLMVAQTFLHSDHSSKIELSLPAGQRRLTANLIKNDETPKIIASVAKKLGKSLASAGLTALQFARREGNPGSSFHTGGTLPMSDTPKDAQTDTAGRLSGADRVHVVDASVLPAIPATTITFTVMANAHRIGTVA